MNIQCTDITYSADKWNFTWPAGLGKVRLVLWGDFNDGGDPREAHQQNKKISLLV